MFPIHTQGKSNPNPNPNPNPNANPNPNRVSIAATQKLVGDATHSIETFTGYLGFQDSTKNWLPHYQTPG